MKADKHSGDMHVVAVVVKEVMNLFSTRRGDVVVENIISQLDGQNLQDRAASVPIVIIFFSGSESPSESWLLWW